MPLNMLKKLFQILLIPIFFCSFLSIAQANVNHIELGDALSNVRLYIKTIHFPDGKPKYMYEIKNTTTNELVYCIEPGIQLIDGDFTEYRNLYDLNIDLSEDDWDYLTRLAYFGYKYPNHNTLKWYAATQFLIWEYIIGETGEIYFIDDNGTQIPKYTHEIAEINALVAKSYLMPDFGLEDNNIYVKYGSPLTLTDKNNVLDEYTITSYSPEKMHVLKNENTLQFDFFKPATETFYFRRSLNTSNAPLIFYNGASQTLMSRGYYNYSSNYITVTYEPPEVLFKKQPTVDVPLSLKGAVYEMYTKENLNTVQRTYTTDELGEFLFDHYEIDDYCLKEIEAPYGFKLNDELYCFTNDDNKTLYLTEEPILKHLDIEKYKTDYNGHISLEPNAEFELFDTKTNKLITKFTTNELGKYELDLWYGTYRLHQTKSSLGFNLVPDYEFTIDENTKDYTHLVLKNPEITGTLKVLKKDATTNDLILDTAAFKIKNLTTNEYLILNNQNIFHTINGILLLENIPYGTYELEEITPPLGYAKNTANLTFSIQNNAELIELEVLNSKLTGNLKVFKKDLITKDLILDMATFKIKNLTTNEYLTLNGKSEFSTQDGILYLENIPYGTYELEEITPPINYEIIKDNKITFTITQEGTIELEVFNLKKLTGSLLIEKLDALTKEPLPNVHFGLYDKDKNFLKEYVTDASGHIEIPELEVGTYYLKELLTLDNYELNTDEIYLEIKNGIKTTITVNNRHLIKVPKTSLNTSFKISTLSFISLIINLFILKYVKKFN